MNRQNCTILLGFVTLLLSLPVAAAVYMEKDAEGNTVFTDRPSSENAKPIKLTPSSTYKAPTLPSAAPSGQSTDQNSDAQGYEFVAITHPADDSPIRANNGELEINIDLTPALKPNHHFVLLMDGVPATEGQSTTLRLQNVDRGTHAIQVQIVDDNGNIIISSESVTFHMLRVAIPRR